MFVSGFLMILDTVFERGMLHAQDRWGDSEECRFPISNFLKPLSLDWMYIIYFILMLGWLGVCIQT